MINPSLELVWYQKYRPQTLEDIVLPDKLKNELKEYVRLQGDTDLILSGTTGIGKSTTARAILNDIGADYLIINGSMNLNIDKLRTDIQNFASTMSMTSEAARKFVLVEEADWMSHQVQPSLRAFVEEFSSNCGFIFTCNYPNKIMKELRGRSVEINFKLSTADKKQAVIGYYKYVTNILDKEKVQYDKEVIVQVIKQSFPDLRKTVNNLQRYAKQGKIDTGIFATDDSDWSELFGYVKTKDFTKLRKWVGLNSDIDSAVFYRKLYDQLGLLVTEASIPALILTIAQYAHWSVTAVDQEINNAACLLSIISEVQFK
jgi:DNA polymerase III delta prime subunit